MYTPSKRQLPLASTLLLIALPAWAVEPIQGTLSANPTGEIYLQVTRDHQSEEFIFERNGDVVRIKDKLPKRTKSGPGTMITVEVPRGSRVRALLISADLEVSELTGPSRLSTVSGSVTVNDSGEEAEINLSAEASPWKVPLEKSDWKRSVDESQQQPLRSG